MMEWRDVFQARTNVILRTELYSQTCYLSGELKLLALHSFLLQLLKNVASTPPLYLRGGGAYSRL